MTQRPISTLATIFGVLAILGVFMPWHALTVDLPNGGVEIVDHQSGLGTEFSGDWILGLLVLGTLALAWFAAFRTKPVLSRGLLVVGAVAFAVAIGLLISDFGRELPSGTTWHDGRTVTEGRGVGLYLSLVASFLACLGTIATCLSPRTIND